MTHVQRLKYSLLIILVVLVMSIGGLVEIVELPDHPWFLAVQFHPEFKSTPWGGHPLFTSYVKAALARHEAQQAQTA